MSRDPEPYDHLRATAEAPVRPGIYRVVGVADDRVTLLALTDERERRRATGRLERVPREALSAFEPAENPDRGIGPAVRNLADGLLQQVLMVGRWLRSLVR